MEKINILKEETMNFAKKLCRKLWIGGVTFIPALKKIGKTRELWKLVGKSKKGKKINRSRIKNKGHITRLEKIVVPHNRGVGT